VYQYGTDIQAKGYEKLWLCKLCHQKRAYSTQLFDAKSTSSITNHLKKAHGITNDLALSKAKARSVQLGLTQSGLLLPPFDDMTYKENIIDTFIACDLSFAFVEHAKFRRLLISDRSEVEAVLSSSHTTVKGWVLDSFQSRQAQIKDQVSLSQSKINLSLDGWRAPTRDDYFAVCAHIINKDYNLVHCLLGFRNVHGVKSGQGIAEITANVINDYEIGQNLGAFMMDNAGDNDAAVKELANGFNIDVDFSRLRCLGHIINLVVKALLFGKGVSKVERELAGAPSEEAFKIWNSRGPIGKLHNICVYVNLNSTRQEVFREFQGGEFRVYRLLVDGGIQQRL
jgi:hypothetical protein